MPMTKGFPRPRKLIKKVSPRLARNRNNYSFDPKWDNKEYPLPYSARMDVVGRLAMSRVKECRVKNLCMVCGDKVEGQPWAYVYENNFVEDAGPFHEKCVRLTQRLCPFVAEKPHVYRFMEVEWEWLDNGEVPEHLWA